MRTQTYSYRLLVISIITLFASCTPKSGQLNVIKADYPFYYELPHSGVLVPYVTAYSFYNYEDNRYKAVTFIIQSEEKDSLRGSYFTIRFQTKGYSKILERVQIGYTEIEDPRSFIGGFETIDSRSQDFGFYRTKFLEILSLLNEKWNKQKESSIRENEKIVKSKSEKFRKQTEKIIPSK
jgi:hypothetical protein